MRRDMALNTGPIWLILGLAFLVMWVASALMRMLRARGRRGHWWRVEVVDQQPEEVRIVPRELPPSWRR